MTDASDNRGAEAALEVEAVTTARLRLRHFTPDDLELLCRLHSDPRVMRYAGGVRTRAQVEALLQDRILGYAQQNPGLGVWATVEKESGRCVGIHLLNNVHGQTDIQVGYLLFPEHWGKGYATEMCRAVLRYGFAVRRLAQIVAITDLANTDSQHVLLKCGMERHGERLLPHPNYAASGPLAWFQRDREDWLAADASAGA